MTVVQSFINNRHYKETPKWGSLDEKTRNMIVQVAALNSSYSSRVNPPKAAGGQPEQLGNKTECAILGFVQALGQKYEELRAKTTEEDLHKVLSINQLD